MATEGKQHLTRTSKIAFLYALFSITLSSWTLAEEYKQGLIPDKVEKAGSKSGSNRKGAAKETPNLKSENNSFPLVPLTLQDADRDFSQFIKTALERIPQELRTSIPYLTDLAKDQNAEMRLSVVVALRVMRPKADEAIPILIKLLNDSDKIVLDQALFTIASYKTEARQAIPELIKLLSNQDMDIVVRATYALGKIGPEARAVIPNLKKMAQNDNIYVRITAIEALANIESKLAVPYLIELINDQSLSVCLDAINSLRQIGPEAKAAIPHLIKLTSNKDTYKRINAIAAIARIEPEAKEVIVTLTKLLNDSEEIVAKEASHALLEVSDKSLQGEAVDTIDLLENAYELMVMSQYEEIRNESTVIKLRVDKLRKLRLKRVQLFISEHPILSLVPLAFSLYTLFFLMSLIILTVYPLLFVYINERLGDIKVPKFVPIIGGADVPLRYVFAIGLFPYRPSVLDAWIAYYIKKAQQSFSERETVKERQEHIPLPILLDGEEAENYTISNFQSIFSHNLNCLLIRGEGGSGKTSLACLLATWAMSENKSERLCPNHLMLPVLIENTLELCASRDSERFLNIINNQIKRLLDITDAPSLKLLRQLLKYRRILVVIDGFSEMDKLSRENILTAINDIPIGTVIITSRDDEHLDGLSRNTIKLLELMGSHVPVFIEKYLENRQQHRLFEGEKLMEISRRLMLIVGNKGITTVLAKYYIELRIAVEENRATDLPDNIPDLMQMYIDIIHRDRSPEAPSVQDIHNVAEIAAWCCLKKTYRPASANYKDILFALGKKANGFSLLTYLKEPLRIIQTDGASYDRIRFVLDSLAEYLAGLYLMKKCGSNRDMWQAFLRKADEQEGAPKTIREFLMALRDCCMSKGAEAQIPNFVTVALTKRLITWLVQDLESSEPEVREEAAKLLGDMRQDAIEATEALTAVLTDKNDSVRQSVEIALAKIISSN